MIRIFPRRTKWTPIDDLSFVGNPPLFRPPDQSVFVSVTFTWDIKEGERLQRVWSNYYSDVKLGGPAFDDPGGEFEPGNFIKKGVTITSRGCIWRCPWCFVPKREGEIRELEIKNGWIVQDNNLLACSKIHLEKVFNMLSKQKHRVIFSGGLDGRLLSTWHIDRFLKLKIKELWFSCDHNLAMRTLKKVADLTQPFPQYKKRCFVMIGFNGENLHEAETRLEKVYSMGFFPFSQLYQGDQKIEYSTAWKALNRKWSRPAAYNKKS